MFISLYVELESELLENELGFNLDALLDSLTSTVIEHERQHKLGYYPALSYLLSTQAVTEEMYEALNVACRISRTIASNLVQSKLKVPFSQVCIDNVNHTAYTIPQVKPMQEDCYDKLWNHYRPQRMRISIQASQISKQPIVDSYKRFVKHLLHRWLSNRFEYMEILTVEVSDD